MKCIVTTIGEPTTDLCLWSLERNGFDPFLMAGDDSLAEKLKEIYETTDEDFVRVDADVVPNRNLTVDTILGLSTPDVWWLQFQCFDWYKQRLSYGGVQFIKKEALLALRNNIGKHLTSERPESQMSRIDEFYNPRRFESRDIVMGLHNYKNDIKRVKDVKARRKQLENYDFELAERLGQI